MLTTTQRAPNTDLLPHFIEDIHAASDRASLLGLVREQFEYFGFNHLAYCSLDDGENLPSEPDNAYLLTYPRDWTNYYYAEGFEAIDPIVDRLAQTSTPFSWAECWKLAGDSRSQRKLTRERNSAGLFCGISIPLHGPLGNVYAFDIARTVDEALDPAVEMCAAMIALQCHTANMRFEDVLLGNATESTLTDREHEVLSLVMRGRNNRWIAEHLGMSLAGVKFHLSNIQKKVNATDRVTAVVKALKLGLMVR